MQRSGDEAKKCRGLDHPGQIMKEWLKHDASINRRNKTRRLGLDHPGRNKQQQPPSPGLDHPGTSGSLAPRTGSSGAGSLSAQEMGLTGCAEAGP